jgi:hypothetical protein
MSGRESQSGVEKEQEDRRTGKKRSGVGSWKLEVGSWKLEVGSWKLEVDRKTSKVS